MKRLIPYTMLAVVALAFSGEAWAQQDDLDVTMKVLPANASAGSAMSEISLPGTPGSASAFGQATAAKARDMKGDLGRDFGQSVSESARDKTNAPKGFAKGQNKGP